MNKKELNKILDNHRKWLCDQGGKRANLYGANLYGANLYGANLRGANLYGANLRGANLYGANLREANLYGANLREANLRGANLEFCKGILSFTGEKHLLIYFKYEGVYYFKIGCITKTCAEWLSEFETIGKEYKYGENTKLYGDVIKLFSQYDLGEKEGE